MAENDAGQATDGAPSSDAPKTAFESIRRLGDRWREFKKRRAEAEREIARGGGRPGETQGQ